MAHIVAADANAWADKVKLNITSLDTALEQQVSSEVLAAAASAYDVSTWVDDTTTPSLVKNVIAMKYVGWYFQRTYSEDSDISTYGIMLLAEADKLLTGISSGMLDLVDAVAGSSFSLNQPTFYPTDDSSMIDPSLGDSSTGGPAFSMGTIW